MSARRAGRRRVVARALEEVGPVEPAPWTRTTTSRPGPGRDRAARRPRSARRRSWWPASHRTPQPTGLRGEATARRYRRPRGRRAAVIDEDGNEVVLDARRGRRLLAAHRRSRRGDRLGVLPSAAAGCSPPVALVDLLDAAPPHPRSGDLIDLADEAPTLHLYVVDLATECRHTQLARSALRRVARRRRGAGPRVAALGRAALRDAERARRTRRRRRA